MFKSRDDTCQQRHLLCFVLCMHWHIHAQGTQTGPSHGGRAPWSPVSGGRRTAGADTVPGPFTSAAESEVVRYSTPGHSGCCHRNPGNRLKSESVDTIVHPCSIAIAACWASATSLPVAPDSRHSRSNMSRWSGPGPTMRAVGRSTSADTNAKDWLSVDGGSKTRGLVTTRMKPDSTRTESANGSGPVAKRVIQAA